MRGHKRYPLDDPIYRLADISLDQGDSLSNEEIDAIVYGQSDMAAEHSLDRVFGILGRGGSTDEFLKDIRGKTG